MPVLNIPGFAQPIGLLEIIVVAVVLVLLIVLIAYIAHNRKVKRLAAEKERRDEDRHKRAFYADSKFKFEINKIVPEYPELARYPHIISEIFLDSHEQLKKFDIKREARKLFVREKGCCAVIEEAEAYLAVYPEFDERVHQVPRTEQEEADKLGLTLDKCHQYEDEWFAQKCPKPLDEDFVVFYINYASSNGRKQHTERRTMSFEDFKAAATMYKGMQEAVEVLDDENAEEAEDDLA